MFYNGFGGFLFDEGSRFIPLVKNPETMTFRLTLEFLRLLKKNNNREWFNANKAKYETARQEFEVFVQDLIPSIGKFDKDIRGVEAKKCIFRIYRDVRFSKDKSPYKNHFGAFITYTGKNSNGPGYYFHIEPGNCFLAGGIYQPGGDKLNLIRKEIDFNLKDFKRILKHADFVKYFGGLSEMGKLKTAPKGFPGNHPAIELLKQKSYIVSHKISEKQVLSEDFLTYTLKTFRALRPLNKFLNTALD